MHVHTLSQIDVISTHLAARRNVVELILKSAKRSGLDLTAFWHAIRASAGNSFTWETAAPNVFAGDYHKFFDMALQTKDIQGN